MRAAGEDDKPDLGISSGKLITFESLFTEPYAIRHHRESPLAVERLQYLHHLARRGMTDKGIKETAALLLHVVRVLKLRKGQTRSNAEVYAAGARWANESLTHRKAASKKGATRFNTAAVGWLRFQGLLVVSTRLCPRFQREFAAFSQFLREKTVYLPSTIASIESPVRGFLNWVAQRHKALAAIKPADIDSYFDRGRVTGWRLNTVAAHSQALRAFFRYAESEGWSRPGLSQTITNPVIRKSKSEVAGPRWKEVKKMIDATGRSSSFDLRAKPILLLCAVYGLRSAEIIRLTLDNFDWDSATFVVKRAKRGPCQRFPIQQELGDVIIRYLQEVRRPCDCRNLFVTVCPPYRPLTNLALIVKKQMLQSGIISRAYGPHALRHACATELLRQGTSLQSIAAFLGHRDIRSVSIYAKFDERSLREVAKFRLSQVL